MYLFFFKFIHDPKFAYFYFIVATNWTSKKIHVCMFRFSWSVQWLCTAELSTMFFDREFFKIYSWSSICTALQFQIGIPNKNLSTLKFQVIVEHYQ